MGDNHLYDTAEEKLDKIVGLLESIDFHTKLLVLKK